MVQHESKEGADQGEELPILESGAKQVPETAGFYPTDATRRPTSASLPAPALGALRGASFTGSAMIAGERERRQKERVDTGYEEPFSFHPMSLHIPKAVWHGADILHHTHLPSLKHGPSYEGVQKGLGAAGHMWMSFFKGLHRPYLPWWGNLQSHKENLLADVLAGLTAGVMLIPQGMAYAMIASLPPIVGLYTGSIAPFVFALLGTSRQLSVGPVALASIYFPTVLQNMGMYGMNFADKAARDHFKTTVASLVTFFVGVLFLIMGTFKLGSLIRYLSHSVMTGFTSAAGLYVGISQLKYILDIHPHKERYHILEYKQIIEHLPHSNPRTVLLGVSAFIVMFTCKMMKRKYPATPARKANIAFRVWYVFATFNTLIVVVICAIIAAFINIPIVGEVKPGLSTFAMPAFSEYHMDTILVESIPVALLGFMEAYAVGRKYAELNRYHIDSNQDLFALGVANVFTSFFGTFVASGSFGRTALNAEAGAKTTFSNLMLGAFIILTLTSLSSCLYYIPMAVLGAVIENAIINLIDVHEFIRAAHIAPLNFCVMAISFLATFLISIQDGLLYGVMASVALVIYQLSTVDTVELGLDTDVPEGGLRFITLQEHAAAHKPVPSVCVTRPLGSLFFGNAQSFRAQFRALIHRESPAEADPLDDDFSKDLAEDTKDVEAPPTIKSKVKVDSKEEKMTHVEYVIVDCCAIKILDLTAISALAEVVDEAAVSGVTVIFSNCAYSLKRTLMACKLLEGLGGEMVTMSTEEVYATVLEWMGLNDDESIDSIAKPPLTTANVASVSSPAAGAVAALPTGGDASKRPATLRPFHNTASTRNLNVRG